MFFFDSDDHFSIKLIKPRPVPAQINTANVFINPIMINLIVSGRYIDNSSDTSLVGLTTANGVITATASGDSGIEDDSGNAATYVLTPTLANGRVTWAAACTPATLC